MSVHERMREFVARLVSSGIAQPRELRGCTPEEISALEARFGLVLPESYRLFLETMGHGAGKLGKSCEELLYTAVFERTRQEREHDYPRYRPSNVGWFLRLLDRLFEFADRIEEKLAKRKPQADPFKLPSDVLVIYSGSCGTSEHWVIRCQGGDDSPVYHYDYEGDRLELRKRFDSVFEFLEMLREEAAGNESVFDLNTNR
jgi:hypothetical protein